MNNKAIGLVAILVIAGSALFLYLRQRPEKLDFSLSEMAGKTMADQVSRVAQKGDVVVISQDLSAYPNETLQAEVKTFLAILAENKAFRVIAVEKVPIPPPGAPGVSKVKFLSILEQHREAAAIVSFMGLPPLKASDLPPGGQRPIIASIFNSPGSQEAAQLKTTYFADIIIAARYRSAPLAGPKPSPQEQFNSAFTVDSR